jgi:hypothetical protein
MINILIVCGIKNFTKYHTTIFEIIKKIDSKIQFTEGSYTIETLQDVNRLSIDSDLYISNENNNYCIFNRTYQEKILDGKNDENDEEIKKFNAEYNNKYDFIILEHCPIGLPSIIPQYIKHFNLLKNNGYFIIFTSSNVDSNFNFKHNPDNDIKYKLPILENIFTKINTFVYQKQNNVIYNMNRHIRNYNRYYTIATHNTRHLGYLNALVKELVKYNPNITYDTYDTSNSDSIYLSKYLKYKKKYLNIQL